MSSSKVRRIVVCLAICCAVWAGLAARSIAADTSEATSSAMVSAFGPATVISGKNARERGAAYGKQFQDGIRRFLQQEVYDALGRNQKSKEAMLKYAAACGEVTREVCPMVAQEIEGIAQGADLTYEEVVLIHAHEELYHRNSLPDVAEGHCTAVAVSPTDSGDGHAYAGQTWDWMTRLAGVSSVVEWRRDGAPSVLAYGYPGMPMGAGLNSDGIALCWTSGGSPPRRDTSPPRVGVPSYALIAHLLAQKDIESVIREAKRDKHAGWFTFVIADADGNLVNIEGSPRGIAIERASNHLARSYYGTPKMTDAGPGEPANLHPRCQQMYDLLEGTEGKNDRKTLERYFTERKYGIMGWQSPLNKTIDVMIFDATARKAYVSRGPAYGVQWREFGFQSE